MSAPVQFASLGNVAIGSTVTSNPVFIVQLSQALVSPQATWNLIDASGTVYSSGAASGITITQTPVNILVSATGSVIIPASLSLNDMGTTYQLQWTLTAGLFSTTLSEQVRVLGTTTTLLGGEDSIELYGYMSTLKINLPIKYDNVGYQLYFGNGVSGLTLNPILLGSPIQVANGYQWSGAFDTSQVLTPGASLPPYTLVWSYFNNGVSQPVYKDTSALFITTPSILTAAKDVQLMVNKSRTTVSGMPDEAFSMVDLLTYLRLGMDTFNASGSPTSFDMTNAQGAIRSYWIQYSCIAALRSQYLLEGTKAFDFSGQSVSLTVDRAQYYDSLASTLESGIVDGVHQLKNVLSKRGLTSGDGSQNPLGLAFGAIGAVGISMSPVSNLRNYGTGSTWWGLGRLL